ncbi:hypothetical protein [Streptomyces sp. AC1-42T]|uniref:hypothetical protein n=1 Tax=Streptomyces sp. AC1-42T TaxID=2218665 RepID=UPI000DADEE5E|nr:hypothetical protein [Streptomyces sp. AC1-42T]PZT71462.1 hypothetical protein DNK55_32635 [Streptomyces sp. AC1-42T]
MASRAQAAWDALNERQRAYMTVLYDHDQAAETARAQDAAAGYYDDTPASVWRWIDVVTPGTKLTSVQRALALKDVRDDGTGSTLQALQRYGLIEVRDEMVEARRGKSRRVTVKLTRAGRAAVRAGTREPGRRRAGELSEYAWERLVRLWRADPGTVRIWGHNTEAALVTRPDPPYAEGRHGDYRITEAGREHYRTRWARYAVLYPDVAAPDPEGAPEPWSAELQRTLDRMKFAVDLAHRAEWTAHRRWEEAEKDVGKHTASQEPEAEAQWCALLLEQARARAALALAHREQATREAVVAIRRYAHALCAAFTASVEGSPAGADLTAAVVAAADAGQDSPKVAQPPLCGLHRVDSAVQEAYGTLAGTRVRRRPLPKQMQPTARSVWKDWTDPPAHDLVVRRLQDLAWTVASYVDGGALRRELHPPAARAVSPAES